jgi:hypothetical protein
MFLVIAVGMVLLANQNVFSAMYIEPSEYLSFADSPFSNLTFLIIFI